MTFLVLVLLLGSRVVFLYSKIQFLYPLFFNASSYSLFAFSKIASEEEFFERRSAIALIISSFNKFF